MSIERMMAGYDVTCDICGQTTFFEADCFSELLAAMRQDGWVSVKEDGWDDAWTHKCPDCSKPYPKQERKP